MKILLATDLYVPIVNGVVTSTSTLAEELMAAGHEVKILTLSQNGKKYRLDNIYYNLSFNLDFIYPFCRGSLKLDGDFYEELLLWKPDIVHTQCEFSTYLFSKKIASVLQIPLVHTYHTSYEDYTHYLHIPKKYAKSFVAFMLRRLLKPVSSIIVPTPKIKSMLEEYGIKKDLEIIPTGVNLKKLEKKVPAKEITALKEQLGIPLEKQVLISLGRLAKEKNTELLLEYFSQITEDNYVMLIVGGGPYQAVLEAKVAELHIEKKVFFTGMVENINIGKYYRLGDIFLCASTSETQGLTYIEALACALPLVCKYDTCLDEILIPEENGCFFENYEEFYHSIKKISEDKDLSKKMKAHAVRIAKKHSKVVFREKVEALYKKAQTI